MTLNHLSGSEESSGQMSPIKTLEGFYGLMMPIWTVTSNSFENHKKLHEELIELCFILPNAGELRPKTFKYLC